MHEWRGGKRSLEMHGGIRYMGNGGRGASKVHVGYLRCSLLFTYRFGSGARACMWAKPGGTQILERIIVQVVLQWRVAP